MSRDFYIKILKPVPRRFCTDDIFDSTELSEAGLTCSCYDDPLDHYHVPIQSRSVYAGMDDIKKYLARHVPDADFQNWAMHRSGGGLHCYGDGWSYDITEETVKSMERPHVSRTVMEYCLNVWSVTDYSGSWLREKCPLYLTDKNIRQMVSWYREYLIQEDRSELEWMLSESGNGQGNIFCCACGAAAYAKQVGGIGFIEVE